MTTNNRNQVPLYVDVGMLPALAQGLQTLGATALCYGASRDLLDAYRALRRQVQDLIAQTIPAPVRGLFEPYQFADMMVALGKQDVGEWRLEVVLHRWEKDWPTEWHWNAETRKSYTETVYAGDLRVTIGDTAWTAVSPAREGTARYRLDGPEATALAEFMTMLAPFDVTMAPLVQPDGTPVGMVTPEQPVEEEDTTLLATPAP